MMIVDDELMLRIALWIKFKRFIKILSERLQRTRGRMVWLQVHCAAPTKTRSS